MRGAARADSKVWAQGGHAWGALTAAQPAQGLGTSAGRGDILAARGASAEFAEALQVPELIESKCASRALPSRVRRAGKELFISLLFPSCFEFSLFEKGGLSSLFT